MMRASVFSLSHLPLLAAALIALAVFFVQDAPASADHGLTKTVWVATLTQSSSTSYLGCNNNTSGMECTTYLSENGFAYAGASYAIVQVGVGNAVTSVVFDKAVPASWRSGAELWLHGTPFTFESATVSNSGKTFAWGDFGTRWSSGDVVRVSLKAPTPPIWSATLTVQDVIPGVVVALGCSNDYTGDECSNTSVLTDDDFTYNGVDYQITSINYFPPSEANFAFHFDKTFPSGLKSSGVIHVDGNARPLANAIPRGDNNEQLLVPRSGLSWSVGDTVELSLSGPALPYGAVVSTDELDVTEGSSGTFTVALTEDPGADKTVHLRKTQFFGQYGNPGPGYTWDQNAVTLDNDTLTFTAGSSGNWATPQTVTVNAPDDDDRLHEQLVIQVLERKSSQGFYQCIDSGNYDYNGFTYVWTGTGSSDYCYGAIDGYGPVGGSAFYSVTGVFVTVDDDDAAIRHCATCGSEGDLGVIRDPNAPENPNADLIADVKEWRDDPRYVSDKRHTDRWDRVLLTLGEAVSDQTLQPMTATEAQGYADRGWTRWEGVAETLAEIEAAAQQQVPPSPGPSQDGSSQDPPAAPNNAPTVVHSPEDVVIANERGSESVPLYTLVDDASLSSTLVSMFHDADGDDLTITASSSDESVATVSVSGHTATVSARSRGTATITVTADDGRGGTVSDDFDVTVKSAPTVASAIGDVSGLEAGTARSVSLSGVFSDADGDDLTITASSLDDRVARATAASDGSALTVTGVSAGATTITVAARDTDGNRVADSFDVSVEASQPRLLTPPTQQQPPAQDPTPTPTPTPTPETDPGPAQEPETPAVVDRYDADGDGSISRTELGEALKGYAAGEITYSQMLEVYMAYRAS